jgi:ATP-binding cassette, subfamily B, bacterial PglK
VPTIRKILDLLTPNERRRAYLLLGMILVMALLDTIGVASILPFLAVLGNPEVVQTNLWLSMAYERLGFTTPESFLFFLGLIVFFALVVSVSFKALTQLALLRFTHMRNHSLSCRLFEGYLGRPYAWFLNRHSSDLGKSILSEVNLVIRQTLIPLLQLIAHGTVALFLIVFLILVDPLLALVVAVILGGSYLLIYKSIRGYMARIGKDRVIANKERYKAAQEALGGIKEVKVFNREKSFFRRYVGPSLRFSSHQANNQVAGQMPMYIMEIVAFGGILLIALYLFKSHGNFHRVLPLLGLYAYAGYRLLPALQQVYKEFVNLRFGLPGLNILHQDMVEFRDNMPDIQGPSPEPLIPEKEIILQDIHFTYPGADIPAIKGLSMTIPARTTVGIVGSTGSGKTTTVDIILGLLLPQSGQLLVDGQPVIEAESGPRIPDLLPLHLTT